MRRSGSRCERDQIGPTEDILDARSDMNLKPFAQAATAFGELPSPLRVQIEDDKTGGIRARGQKEARDFGVDKPTTDNTCQTAARPAVEILCRERGTGSRALCAYHRTFEDGFGPPGDGGVENNHSRRPIEAAVQIARKRRNPFEPRDLELPTEICW